MSTNQTDATPQEQTKFCPRCRQTKPATAFSRCARSGDGRFWYCQSCDTARLRMYRVRKFGLPGRSHAETLAWHQQAATLRAEYPHLSWATIGQRFGVRAETARQAVKRLRQRETGAEVSA